MAKSESEPTEPPKPGLINLPGIFAAAADDLLAAVTQGRILYNTQNIRDSGAPLEAALRALFARLLPSPFVVQHGYLFDTQSHCTPQIDLIIADAARSQVMLTAPEGATYAPFTDAYAIIEIKTSADHIGEHLDQIGAQIDAIERMQRDLRTQGNITFPSLISALVLGKSDGLKEYEIVERWTARAAPFPTFVFLLDRGQIILPEDDFSSLLGMGDEVSPVQRPAGAHLAFHEKGADDREKRGNALLWLFYAVQHRLRESQTHNLTRALNELSTPSENLMDWRKAGQAAQMLADASAPFAAAMMRDFNLKPVRALNAARPKRGRPRKEPAS